MAPYWVPNSFWLGLGFQSFQVVPRDLPNHRDSGSWAPHRCASPNKGAGIGHLSVEKRRTAVSGARGWEGAGGGEAGWKSFFTSGVSNVDIYPNARSRTLGGFFLAGMRQSNICMISIFSWKVLVCFGPSVAVSDDLMNTSRI